VKRILGGVVAVVVIAACAQQQKVRKASEASSDARAGKIAPTPKPAARSGAPQAAAAPSGAVKSAAPQAAKSPAPSAATSPMPAGRAKGAAASGSSLTTSAGQGSSGPRAVGGNPSAAPATTSGAASGAATTPSASPATTSSGSATAPAAAKAAAATAPGSATAPSSSAAKSSAAAPAATAATAAAPVEPGTSAKVAAPTVTRTEGGVGLLELPLNEKAIVNLQLRFRSGAIDDPPGKSGVTSLAARMMTEGGTRTLDSKALLNALFPLAAELDVRVDKELTTFSVRVHKDNLDKLLPILTDVLLNPRWDPAEFKRLREAAVNDVEKRLRQGDDENLGKEALWELLYRNHPYGRLTLGHLSDLKSLQLDDLKAQAHRVFTADRLIVGVSGGYPEQLGEKLAKTLAALPEKSAAEEPVPQARAHGPRIELVEKVTDSTAISMGMPWTLSHKDADWAAMSVARSAFGEHRQFNGRLMNQLREARGLNYGDYAYAEYFEQEGGDAVTAQTGRARRQQQFSIWLRPVQNENRLFALRAALYELQKSVTDEPFTEQEVANTKGFLDGYLLLFDQTDARRLGFALDDAFYGMNGFLGTWRAQLRSVTAEQVNAAWRKRVDPSKLEIVMVGPGMAEVKKTILEGAASPMHYQKDAQGNVAEKPKALTDVDAVIEKLPLGARTDADVVVVPVEKLFE
jgi:zinc protease